MNLLRRVLWAVLLVAAWCFSAASSSAAVKEYAVIETSKGTLEVELWSTAAPKTVQNFKYLADLRFYDGTAFHRLISGFMVQGGDPNTRDVTKSSLYGTGGPGYTIADEFSSDLSRAHVRGVISMAHNFDPTKNESVPNSGGSQFFIMFGTAADLDGKYASFGKVTSLDPNDTIGAKNKATLEALEAEAVVAQSDATGAEVSKPVNRLEVKTVRIRTEVSESSTAVFKAGNYSGLLSSLSNRANRMGMYDIAVTSTGSFSGTFQYFGRKNVVAGKFVLPAGKTEATYSVTLDPKALVPMKLDLALRLASSSAVGLNVMSVQLSDAATNATDFASTKATGTGELVDLTTVKSRYSMFLSGPETSGGSLQRTDLTGYGHINASRLPTSGVFALAGKLPDGTVFTASRSSVSENGHIVIPIYDYKLRPELEAYRAGFPNMALGRWVAKINSFRLFQLSGVIELPTGDSLRSQIIWQRAEQVSGLFESEIAGYVSVYTVPWTPVEKGKMLAPFTSSARTGTLVVLGVSAFEFTVLPNNTVTFVPNAYAPTLKLDGTTGFFSGTYRETTGVKATRSFSGVLLPSTVFKIGTYPLLGPGFSIDASVSRKVYLLLPEVVSP